VGLSVCHFAQKKTKPVLHQAQLHSSLYLAIALYEEFLQPD
jgi:hypothetical protein